MKSGKEGTSPHILVALPAYQEERSIGGLVRSLREQYPYDVLVVNDGSMDITGDAAREAGATVLDLPCNLGIGGAVQTGFLYASDRGYDVVVRIDGDRQHEVEDIPKGLEPLLAGRADAVIGSRFLGETKYRGASRGSSASGSSASSSTSGFFAINRLLVAFCSDHYPSDYPEVDAYILMHRLKCQDILHHSLSRGVLYGESDAFLSHQLHPEIWVNQVSLLSVCASAAFPLHLGYGAASETSRGVFDPVALRQRRDPRALADAGLTDQPRPRRGDRLSALVPLPGRDPLHPADPDPLLHHHLEAPPENKKVAQEIALMENDMSVNGTEDQKHA